MGGVARLCQVDFGTVVEEFKGGGVVVAAGEKDGCQAESVGVGEVNGWWWCWCFGVRSGGEEGEEFVQGRCVEGCHDYEIACSVVWSICCSVFVMWQITPHFENMR